MASKLVSRSFRLLYLSDIRCISTSPNSYHKDVLLHQRNIDTWKRKSSSLPSDEAVEISLSDGLPVITVPLPSRQEKCQFILKPISNTLGDLTKFICEEDGGVDRIAAYSTNGERIAKSTSIESLLRRQFILEINNKRHTVVPPAIEDLSNETLSDISSLKNQISQLYSTLNIEEYQLRREKELKEKLEEMQLMLQPIEDLKSALEVRAEKKTKVLTWFGLGAMGLQFGILARLTWWEYSWDIMEPVTYFVTYGTSMAMYAYYVTTKQEYVFPLARDREFLLSLHKYSRKHGLDVDYYNKLCNDISKVKYDLERLRDPLQLQLPIQFLLPKKE